MQRVNSGVTHAFSTSTCVITCADAFEAFETSLSSKISIFHAEFFDAVSRGSSHEVFMVHTQLKSVQCLNKSTGTHKSNKSVK